MKYNSSNKPLVCMQTQSTCYNGTSKMTVKGILWHSTGANNPTLKRYVQPSDTKPSADTYSKTKWLEVLGKNPYGNDWNHIEHMAGLNAWIGKLADGSVTAVQTMPWDYKPWGCGSGSKGSCNDGWIQFEICEDGLTDKSYFNKVYQEACELTAYLCKLYNINPNGTVTHNGVKVPTILCHQDSYKLGLGCNHGDIYHWFPNHGKNMETVRADVAALLKTTTGTTTSSSTTTAKTYKVVTAINRYASADDAVAQKNAKSDKLAAGTYYIYTKYPNGINGVYNISTDKTGVSAGSWINPKENIIKESTTTTTTTSVKTYKVVTPINRYTSAGDAKAQTNAKSEKLNAGTYYIYTKYPDGLDSMYNISTDKTGASAGSWINPKENVVKESTTTTTATQKLYRVRKSKDDAASQKGAFSDIDNAKDCCQTAGAGYHVFDWDYKIVYSYKAPAAATPEKTPSTPATPTPVTLTSIKITSKPTKLEYLVGDRKIDRTGLVVTATYSDKSTKTVTNFNISGFDTSKAGTVTVKIAFEGKSDTFNVVVKEKEVVPPAAEPEVVEPAKVYELDYPEKTKIVDKSIKRTESDCVKAIKKILSNNKSFDVEIAKAFFELAPKYGIDPMMAIAQSILETGWFKYAGSAVTSDQHNYCGLGVTSNGVKGAAFDTIKDGVAAQLQHLFAYGCKDSLPAGDKVLDPRFNLVTRGIATYWQQLAGRWACPGYDTKTYDTPQKAMEAGNTYGQKILALCNTLKAETVSADDLEKYFPTKKEEPVKPEETTEAETTKPSEPDTKEPEVTVPETTKPEPENPEPEIATPETEEPGTEEPNEFIETENEVEPTEDPDIDTRANSLAELIFKCIKKLIKMIAEVFSKGE